ncbi:MAG: flagellar basal body M-ring protein FliF [Betaproteobacteria bacterium]|nr:MAG: flagellar basal body M-ring protein FliF [Betaproteobacteria bacterium]
MASPGQALAEHLAGLTQAPLQQKIGYLITLAALIAVLGGMWMWSKSPDYRVLFANLNDRDGGAVVAALAQMNVAFRFSEVGGAIMVPAHQLHEVRMKLAAQDLPRGGAAGGDGFRTLDNQKFGTSNFVEQINYQRALETELARSIQTLANVQAARVHLALNRPSVFVREAQKPSASVVLQLASGRSLEPGQVNAIVNLVSSSVPDLPARNVSVVDQTGTLLSSSGATANGLDPTQLKYKRDLEQDLVRRVETLVSALVGPGNVRAQVTAELDFSKVERVDEKYEPNGQPENAAVRSSNISESVQTGSGANGGGVPGAASNQPPQVATAPISAPAGTQAPQVATTQPMAAQGTVNQQKNATTNYEVNKNLVYSVQQVGTLRRLSLAVVVNNRTGTDSEGTVTSKALTDEEKQQITQLIKSAVGFDDKRGDSLNLLNAAFTQPSPQPIEETPMWKNPELLSSGMEVGRNVLIAGIALYLVLGVLRPMLRSFAAPPPAKQTLLSAPPGEGNEAGERAPTTYDANLQAAKQIARQDPKLVANVVRGWVANDG